MKKAISVIIPMFLVPIGVDYLWCAREEALAQEWEQSFEIGDDGKSGVAVVDLSDDLIVAGIKKTGDSSNSDYGYYIIKYSGVDGNVLWQKSIDGAQTVHPLKHAVARLALDSLGDVVFAGLFKNEEGTYYLTFKYSGIDGGVIWEKSFVGGGYNPTLALAVDSQDNVIVTGKSNEDYYVVKYEGTDGIVLWEATYDGGASLGDSPTDLAIDPSNNVIITGTSYHIIKYSGTDGGILWHRVCDASSPPRIAVDSLGNVILTSQFLLEDYYTVKYASSDGSILWEKIIDGSSDEGGYYCGADGILVDSADNVIITGHSWRGVRGNSNNFDYETIKYSGSDGSIIWHEPFDNGSEAGDCPNSMVRDSQDNIIVSGSSGFTIKHHNSDGTIIWRKLAVVVEQGLTDVALDSSDNVFVTGKTQDRFDGIIKYDSSIIKYISSDPLPPTVGTDPASDIVMCWRDPIFGHDRYCATLNGTIIANGDITTAWFEYGSTTLYGEFSPPEFMGNGWESKSIEFTSTEFRCDNTFHFRLVASNIKGTTYGQDQSFTTLACSEGEYETWEEASGGGGGGG